MRSQDLALPRGTLAVAPRPAPPRAGALRRQYRLARVHEQAATASLQGPPTQPSGAGRAYLGDAPLPQGPAPARRIFPSEGCLAASKVTLRRQRRAYAGTPTLTTVTPIAFTVAGGAAVSAGGPATCARTVPWQARGA